MGMHSGVARGKVMSRMGIVVSRMAATSRSMVPMSAVGSWQESSAVGSSSPQQLAGVLSSWQQQSAAVGSWQESAAVGSSQQQSAAVGSSWQQLAVGSSWQKLAAVGSSWQPLAAIGSRMRAVGTSAGMRACACTNPLIRVSHQQMHKS